jgi:hypothetical protein
MALWAYAFQTVAGLKTSLGITGTNLDAIIEDVINEASQMVEAAWGRDVVSRGAVTEYYPRDTSLYYQPLALPSPYAYDPNAVTTRARAEIYLNEWPVVSVTSVNEDPAGAYAAGSLLVAGTDYNVSKPSGKLIRLAGPALPKSWLWSYRAVKVVYTAGYQNTAGNVPGTPDAVPFALMRVFHELAAWMIRQRKPGGDVGMQSVSDATGSRTFSGPAYVTTGMQASLSAAGARSRLEVRAGERDA